MRYNRPQLIVKAAAVITGLLALWALVVLVFLMSRLMIHDANSPRFYKDLGLCGLVAILPLMFIWAAIQAWRLVPKGVVSLSSGWILFGLTGSISSLSSFFIVWQAKAAVFAVAWIFVFLFGVLIAWQERKIANGPP